MIKRQAVKKIFLAIGSVLETGETIFSRDSLLSKLRKLDYLEFGNQYYLNKSIKRMEARNLMEARNRKGKVFYCLTSDGVAKLNSYKFRELKINKKGWDGFWRVVTFDIPENKRIGRNIIRQKFNEWGFYPLQKSVFVFPYDCKKEIRWLADFFDISESIDIFLTRSIEGRTEELKDFFEM